MKGRRWRKEKDRWLNNGRWIKEGGKMDGMFCGLMSFNPTTSVDAYNLKDKPYFQGYIHACIWILNTCAYGYRVCRGINLIRDIL